jgi:hypothetical protein
MGNGKSTMPAAVVAQEWLERVLADGPRPVRELEQRLRAARLLGPEESLSQARLWRAARAALGVRSIQRARAWYWQLRPLPVAAELLDGDPVSVPARALPANDPGPGGVSSVESAAAGGASTTPPESGLGVVASDPVAVVQAAPHVAPPPESAVERPAIVRARVVDPAAEILSEWARDVSRLDPRRPPAGIPVFRWVVFVDDASGFLVSDFSTKAARLAWSTFDLFGLARERPMERRDLAGLCWVLQHGRVVELFHDSATWVRGTSAFAHTRRRAPEGSMVLPWLIK